MQMAPSAGSGPQLDAASSAILLHLSFWHPITCCWSLGSAIPGARACSITISD